MDDTLQHKAVRVALANALVHADYYGRAGVVAIRYPDRVEVANPGLLRTPADVIRAGGVSDPRNGTLATMFNLLSIGEKAGSDFDVLRQAAASVGKPEPELRELYDPERVYLTLHLEANGLGFGSKRSDGVVSETTSDPVTQSSDPVTQSSDPVTQSKAFSWCLAIRRCRHQSSWKGSGWSTGQTSGAII